MAALPFTYFLALREDWINVNVGKREHEAENVVHGDVDAVAELASTKDSFKGDQV